MSIMLYIDGPNKKNEFEQEYLYIEPYDPSLEKEEKNPEEKSDENKEKIIIIELL